MLTLLRNLLSPLLFIGPVAAYCAFMAADTTRDSPEYYLRSLFFPQLFCLAAYVILVLCLYRLPRTQAMKGFLVGGFIGGMLAFGSGMFGLMLLAFSGDSGISAAAQVLPVTLSIFAVLVLVPLALGAGLGALVGEKSGARSPAASPGGAPQ